MINKLYAYLLSHKSANFLIATIYFFAVVLPHEKVGLLLANLAKWYGRAVYDKIFILFFGAVLMLSIVALSKKIMQHPKRKLILFYLAATIVFASICVNALFVLNVEAIHFVQYAGFAILIYPLIKNYLFTIVYTTFAGILDECYQYFYLAPERTDYLDFNDMIINLIGAAFGAIVVKTLYPQVHQKISWILFKKVKLHWIFAIFAALSFAILFSQFVTYSPATPSISGHYLLKEIPTEFWSRIHPKKDLGFFHIIKPINGIIYIFALWGFYLGLDKD